MLWWLKSQVLRNITDCFSNFSRKKFPSNFMRQSFTVQLCFMNFFVMFFVVIIWLKLWHSRIHHFLIDAIVNNCVFVTGSITFSNLFNFFSGSFFWFSFFFLFLFLLFFLLLFFFFFLFFFLLFFFWFVFLFVILWQMVVMVTLFLNSHFFLSFFNCLSDYFIIQSFFFSLFLLNKRGFLILFILRKRIQNFCSYRINLCLTTSNLSFNMIITVLTIGKFISWKSFFISLLNCFNFIFLIGNSSF